MTGKLEGFERLAGMPARLARAHAEVLWSVAPRSKADSTLVGRLTVRRPAIDRAGWSDLPERIGAFAGFDKDPERRGQIFVIPEKEGDFRCRPSPRSAGFSVVIPLPKWCVPEETPVPLGCPVEAIWDGLLVRLPEEALKPPPPGPRAFPERRTDSIPAPKPVRLEGDVGGGGGRGAPAQARPEGQKDRLRKAMRPS